MSSTTTSNGELASVHLCDFPEPGERDEELEFRDGERARKVVRLGLAARGQGNRQAAPSRSVRR